MASNIPKFASFRPKTRDSKPAPTDDDKHHASSSRHDKVDGSKKHQQERRDDSNKRGKRYGRDGSDEYHRRDRSQVPKDTERMLPTLTNNNYNASHSQTPRRNEDKLYFTDRKGDPAILAYGGLSHYDIPTYRRIGNGRILGLPHHLRIDRDRSTDKTVYLSGGLFSHTERPLMSKLARPDQSRSLRFVKSADSVEEKTQHDFISLQSSEKKAVDDDLGSEVEDYRSLDPQKDQDILLDSDIEYESTTEERLFDNDTKQRNSELIQRTRDHPSDVNGWLELIKHQEAMMRLGREFASLSTTDNQNLAEVRITSTLR